MTSPAVSYHGYRFPPEIVSYVVWLYHHFCLSFRDTEDLLSLLAADSTGRREGKSNPRSPRLSLTFDTLAGASRAAVGINDVNRIE